MHDNQRVVQGRTHRRDVWWRLQICSRCIATHLRIMQIIIVTALQMALLSTQSPNTSPSRIQNRARRRIMELNTSTRQLGRVVSTKTQGRCRWGVDEGNSARSPIWMQTLFVVVTYRTWVVHKAPRPCMIHREDSRWTIKWEQQLMQIITRLWKFKTCCAT